MALLLTMSTEAGLGKAQMETHPHPLACLLRCHLGSHSMLWGVDGLFRHILAVT